MPIFSAAQGFIIKQYFAATHTTHSDTFPTYVAMSEQAARILPELHTQGYITASVDSFHYTDTSIVLHIYKGDIYKWQSIQTANIPPEIAKNVNALLHKQEGHALLSSDIQMVTEYVLKYADDNGYPFAQVGYKDVVFHADHSISATLAVDLGKTYQIDSINVLYGGRLDKTYFYKYLDIQEGMTYSAKKMKTLSPLIASLPFLQESAPWKLQFGVNDNSLDIFLVERKANQANAILGIQPTPNADKKFDFTADVLLSFQNELGYGERMKFAYQQLQKASPKMEVAIYWPYLFGSNFGAEGAFEYQKFDTLFRKTSGNIGVLYQFSAHDYVKVFGEFGSNRVISYDTAFVSLNKRLPPNMDLSKTGGGLEIHLSKVNNVLNPRKGYLLNASLIGSQRKILPNNAIEKIYDIHGENYGYLYDSLLTAQLQTKIRTSISGFIPLYRMFTLRLGYENGYIHSKDMFRNELFQIGGFKLLRGFNEESIFSHHFHIGTIEPRILLGPVSHLYAFSDFGYVATLNLENRPTSFNVLSFGIGGTLSTESGIFNLAFALGKQGNEQLRIRNTTVHFGYAVYF